MLQLFGGTIATGIGSFLATNIDDLLLLMLLFAQADAQVGHSSPRCRGDNSPRPDRPIILGQYLGFCATVGISLLGFWGGMIFPKPLMGSLGVVPITLGVSSLGPGSRLNPSTPNPPSVLARSWNTQVSQVTAITIACGGDNVGVYAPLFATLSIGQLAGILGVFFVARGAWCWLARRLSRQQAIAQPVARYGRRLAPWVLISLGVWILIKSETLVFLAKLAVG